MSNVEKPISLELLRQVIELELLDSNSTANCVHCKAAFPKEYGMCPQCNTN